MRYVTPRCRLVGEASVEELREEMLNTLGMIDDKLPNQILDLERLQDDDNEDGLLMEAAYER